MQPKFVAAMAFAVVASISAANADETTTLGKGLRGTTWGLPDHPCTGEPRFVLGKNTVTLHYKGRAKKYDVDDIYVASRCLGSRNDSDLICIYIKDEDDYDDHKDKMLIFNPDDREIYFLTTRIMKMYSKQKMNIQRRSLINLRIVKDSFSGEKIFSRLRIF